MNCLHHFSCGIVFVALATWLSGCNQPAASPSVAPAAPASLPGSSWLGIPSAVNEVIVFLHESTGWLLNKSEVSIKKVGDVRATEATPPGRVADFQIAVKLGEESFETTAKDVPCDNDGIPTEASVDRLRTAVEEIKVKMKRLQN